MTETPSFTRQTSSEAPPTSLLKQSTVVACVLLARQSTGEPVLNYSTDRVNAASEPKSEFAFTLPTTGTHHLETALPHNRGGTYLRCCVLLI